MSTVTPDTVLIVPCFDEARRLDVAAFEAWSDATPEVRFLLVDDGSRDATAAILQGMAERRPERFEALLLPVNRGKAEAVRAGVAHALSDPRTAIVGFWDADLATPLDHVPDLRATLLARPDVEIALGSRVRLLGRQIERPALRHYFGRVAAGSASFLLGMPVYDTQCGAKLFRRTEHLATLFAEPFSTRWAFDVEVLARWLGCHPAVTRADMGRYLVEHPLRVWLDVRGSKVKLLDMVEAPLDLFRIWLRYRRQIRRGSRA